jgi:hypothetical protein
LGEFFTLAERFKVVRKFLTLLFSGPLLAISIIAISPANASSSSIEINSVAELSCTSVEILFTSSIPKKSLAYYVITASADPSLSQTKNVKKIIKTKATGLITAKMKNLNPGVAYKFSISAKTTKAKSINSEAMEYVSICNLMDVLSNLPADWGNPKPPPIAAPWGNPKPPPIAAPVFTLSSSSETRTVNTAATGFTINSTGGAIASFAINATPAGMSFNTITGALTGTPTSVASATAYTITATNASGSATQTFTLTVNAAAVIYNVGDTGPGGGKIFYKAATPFACGPSLNLSCTYLEAAPALNGVIDNAGRAWSTGGNQNISVPDANGIVIGTGYKNSLAIAAQTGNVTASSAAMAARAYSGGSKTDWYLPSKDELTELWTRKITVGGFENTNYWSSSEFNASNGWRRAFQGSSQSGGGKSNAFYYRPIRAF